MFGNCSHTASGVRSVRSRSQAGRLEKPLLKLLRHGPVTSEEPVLSAPTAAEPPPLLTRFPWAIQCFIAFIFFLPFICFLK